jgi:hypothetical protein
VGPVKYEIKLLAVMLMVIAPVAVLTTAATSDEMDDKQSQWVYGEPWFGWYPSRSRKEKPSYGAAASRASDFSFTL